MNSTADNPAVIQHIKSLNAELERARDAYYRAAQPIMPDAEYDKKEKNLRALVKASPWLAEYAPVLTTVGSDLTASAGRVRHTRPMLSIENKYDKKEIVDFQREVLHGGVMLIEPKRDGISCELRYRDRELVMALTRGSGSEGEEITAQVSALSSIPKKLSPAHSVPLIFNVRGELVMRKSELERINKQALATGGKTYASTRNLAAGTMKLKDLAEVAKREILFVPWEVYGDEGGLPDSGYQRMIMLSVLGFPKYEGFLVDSETDVLKVLDHVLEANKQSEIIADGVVAKADSHKVRRELGGGSKYANYQTCYKPQGDFASTYLRKVVWQVGRTGKLTPVGECDPVNLAGATVTRATLNNLSFIEEMGLSINAKVKMLRSGGVIPEIDGVIEEGDTPVTAPKHCPECGSNVEIEKDERSTITTHWCQNYECPGRVTDLFYFIAGRGVLEIDGLGEDMASKIAKGGYARDLGELYEFQIEGMEGLTKLGEEKFEARMSKMGFSGVIFRKMVQSMEAAKSKDWSHWLTALGIPMIGNTLSKVLVTKLNLTSESMKDLPALLLSTEKMEIEGIGFHKSAMILDWAKDKRNALICEQLYGAGVRPKAPEKLEVVAGEPLKGVAFCITGEFSEDREKIAVKLAKLGAVSKSGVTSKCNLLIVGEAPGKTKLTKAKELGIKQVGKEWLEKTLAENGMELSGSGFGFEMDEA